MTSQDEDDFISMVNRFIVLHNCPGTIAKWEIVDIDAEVSTQTFEFRNDIHIEFESLRLEDVFDFFDHLATFDVAFTDVTRIKLSCFLHQFCLPKGRAIKEGKQDVYYRLFTDGPGSVDLMKLLSQDADIAVETAKAPDHVVNIFKCLGVHLLL